MNVYIWSASADYGETVRVVAVPAATLEDAQALARDAVDQALRSDAFYAECYFRLRDDIKDSPPVIVSQETGPKLFSVT